MGSGESGKFGETVAYYVVEGTNQEFDYVTTQSQHLVGQIVLMMVQHHRRLKDAMSLNAQVRYPTTMNP